MSPRTAGTIAALGLCLGLLAGLPAAAQSRSQATGSGEGTLAERPLAGGPATRPFVSLPWPGLLLLVGLVAGAGGLVWRRRAGWPRAGMWRVVQPRRTEPVVRLAGRPLTPQASVHVVRWNDEELLLGCGPQQVTVLARRPAPAEDAVA